MRMLTWTHTLSLSHITLLSVLPPLPLLTSLSPPPFYLQLPAAACGMGNKHAHNKGRVEEGERGDDTVTVPSSPSPRPPHQPHHPQLLAHLSHEPPQPASLLSIRTFSTLF
jgi:hypothetical protein